MTGHLVFRDLFADGGQKKVTSPPSPPPLPKFAPTFCPSYLQYPSERHGGFSDCREEERRFGAVSTDFLVNDSGGGAPLVLIGRFLNNGRGPGGEEEDTVVRQGNHVLPLIV